MVALKLTHIFPFLFLLAWTNGCIYLGLDDEEERKVHEELLTKRRKIIEEHEKERLRMEMLNIKNILDEQLKAQSKVYEKLRLRKLKYFEDRDTFIERKKKLTTEESYANVDLENFPKFHKEKENKIHYLKVKVDKMEAQMRELHGLLADAAKRLDILLERLRGVGEKHRRVEREMLLMKVQMYDMNLLMVRSMEGNNQTTWDSDEVDEDNGIPCENSPKFLRHSGESMCHSTVANFSSTNGTKIIVTNFSKSVPQSTCPSTIPFQGHPSSCSHHISSE